MKIDGIIPTLYEFFSIYATIIVFFWSAILDKRKKRYMSQMNTFQNIYR